jgi:hypothetical protein
VQDDILKLAYEVSNAAKTKIHLIESVMREAKIVAMNARIEAARAGQAGVGFAILAEEMGKISGKITDISSELRTSLEESANQLTDVGTDLVIGAKGSRYADLALNVIEIIDRNLYERSCDVRWWATDSAVVACVEEASEAKIKHACERLNTILKSYTVYLDLCIVNLQGIVIACGKPQVYTQAIGGDVSKTKWFQDSLQTRSGEEYAVAEVRKIGDLNQAQSATYATAIRAGGRSNGEVIGVLGISFDWAPQAAAVVKGVRLSEEERDNTRVLIIDANHRVIAASDDAGLLSEIYELNPTQACGYYRVGDHLVAYALTPGYETYRGLGWYGVIEARL